MSRKAHRACVMLDMAALAGPVSCAVSPSYYSLYSEVRQEFSFPHLLLISLLTLLKTQQTGGSSGSADTGSRHIWRGEKNNLAVCSPWPKYRCWGSSRQLDSDTCSAQ